MKSQRYLFVAGVVLGVLAFSGAYAHVGGGSTNDDAVLPAVSVTPGGSANDEGGVSDSDSTQARSSNGPDSASTSLSQGISGSSQNEGEGVQESSSSVFGTSSNGGDSNASNPGIVLGGSSNGEDGVTSNPAVGGGSQNGEDNPSQPNVTVGGGSNNGEDSTSSGNNNPPATNPPSGGGPIVQVGGGGPTVFYNPPVFNVPTSTPEAELPRICIAITGYARLGARNNASEVSKIQTFLRTYEGANISVSGVYDSATVKAVRAFQTKYAAEVLAPWGTATPTGYAYITTIKKMNELSCRMVRPLTWDEHAIIATYRQSLIRNTAVPARVPVAPPVLPAEQTTSTATSSEPIPEIGSRPVGNEAPTANVFSTVWGAITRFFGGLFGR